jgi:4'-phosphopantetheinyl transferase
MPCTGLSGAFALDCEFGPFLVKTKSDMNLAAQKTFPKTGAPLQLSRSGEPIEAALGAAFQAELRADLPHFLDIGEKKYLESLKYPLRRESYLLGRLAAKRALAVIFPEAEFDKLEVARGVFDQPVVISRGHQAEISIAHSGGAAVAVACRAGHPIGVDLEQLSGEKAEFLQSSFTERESETMRKLSMPAETARYLLWTIKEALAKTLRCGLMVPFEILELSELQQTANEFTAHFTHFAQYKAHSWLLQRNALSIVLPKKTTIQFKPEQLLEPALREHPTAPTRGIV